MLKIKIQSPSFMLRNKVFLQSSAHELMMLLIFILASKDSWACFEQDAIILNYLADTLTNFDHSVKGLLLSYSRFIRFSSFCFGTIVPSCFFA